MPRQTLRRSLAPTSDNRLAPRRMPRPMPLAGSVSAVVSHRATGTRPPTARSQSQTERRVKRVSLMETTSQSSRRGGCFEPNGKPCFLSGVGPRLCRNVSAAYGPESITNRDSSQGGNKNGPHRERSFQVTREGGRRQSMRRNARSLSQTKPNSNPCPSFPTSAPAAPMSK